MQENRNPKPWARFTVGRPTHQEVKKTSAQLKAERDRRKRLADIEERELLKKWGLL